MKHCYLLEYVLDAKEEVGCISYHEFFETLQAAKNRQQQVALMFSRYFDIYTSISKKY